MTPRLATLLFVLAVTVLVAVYDSVALAVWGFEGTISGVARWWATQNPNAPAAVAALLTLLLWHWFS